MKTITLAIAQIISLTESAIQKSPTGVTFFKMDNYTNSQGETSNILINIGASYQNAKDKDFEYLRVLDLKAFKKDTESDLDLDLLSEARKALMTSLVAPQKAQSEAQKNAYTRINDAIKVHNETGAVYVFGNIVKKDVLVEGEYKETTNSKPLTVAKDLLRKGMKSTKYRMYKVEEITKISGGTETLIFERV